MTSDLRATALAVLSALADGSLTPKVAQLWPGWGRLSSIFDSEPTPQWAEFAGQVAELVSDDAWRTAREVCDTSFYTPDWLAAAVWELVLRSGFTGGRVFYPGVGAGSLAAAAPAHVQIEWTGVEIDHVSAAVAACQFPGMQMIGKPLQQATVPSGTFDLAIANVPFTSGHVWDEAAGFNGSGLHNYFLARMVTAVRPGGLIVALTSRHSVDSGSVAGIGDTEVSTMIRLPAGTFPGTDVVADLVVLRRTPSTGRVRGRLTTETSALGPGSQARVSRYWFEHPELVAGQMETTGNRYAGFLTVTAEDPRARVADVVAAVADLLPYAPGEVPELELAAETDGRREGSFHVADNGAVVRIVDGSPVPVKASAELRALIELRDLTRDLLDLEADHGRPDAELDGPRAALAAAYSAYCDQWGPLGRGVLHEGPEDPETGRARMTWRRPPMGGFRGDPDAHVVWSIEHYDPDTGEATPAALLSRRVNRPVPRPTSAQTPAEAIAISLAESGTVELDRIAELLGCDPDVADQLAGLAFYDPELDRWIRRSNYLCGDVAAKHAAAEAAGLTANAAALAEVIPQPIIPAQIRARLGAPWIPATDVADFLREVFGERATVEHCRATGRWEVKSSARPSTAPLAFTVYGTEAMSAYQLTEAALNGRTPVVTCLGPDRREVRDPEQTMAAQEKLELVQDKFSSWLWEEPVRSARLAAEYNRRFNRHVARVGDGDYLVFPGMNTDQPLWPWQRRMVDRVLNTPATLCGHAVGAGKTRTMLAAAWMLRRFGLANKPLIVVPNHLLEQIAAEATRMFPGGRWLIAGQEDLAGDARRLFAARCATGDWDAVIITQSGFGLIPVHPSTEERWLLDQKDALADAMRSDSNYWSGKQIARKLRGLDTRLSNLRSNTGDLSTIWWEQLGVDHLSVDEADAYLRLPITTSASGFSMGASKRATDLLLKIMTLRQQGGDRPHFAAYTGTPWRNTIAETFVWQTYLQPDRLVDAGVELFDSWAAQFVTMKARIEPAPDGSGLRIVSRPTRFQNVAALFGIFDEVADILPSNELPIDRPVHHTETIVVRPSAAQQRVTASLIARADKLRANSHGGSDNMLAICGDGRRSALDPQLVGVRGTAPKLKAAAVRVARIWSENQHRQFPNSTVSGVLQVVFCDQGTPRPGDPQTYGRLRTALIEHGVPAHLIRFVHDASNDKAKARLFAQCRRGEVQVLVASTAKAGLGTNIQTRLAAVHHLDAPWRPADIEQREGRALRPGNLCPEVSITRYVTSETFDTFIWSVLTRKAGWIEQGISSRANRLNDIDDIGEVEIDFARVTAIAADRLLRRAELVDLVRRLRTARAVDGHSAVAAQRTAQQNRAAADRCRRIADDVEPLAPLVTGPDPAGFSVLIETIRQKGRPRSQNPSTGSREVRWRGLPVTVRRNGWDDETRTVGVVVTHRYREVWSTTLNPREVARRRFVSDLADTLDQWADRLPGMAEELRRRAATHDANAEVGEQLACGWTYAKQPELDAAEAELAQLDATLAAAAEAA